MKLVWCSEEVAMRMTLDLLVGLHSICASVNSRHPNEFRKMQTEPGSENLSSKCSKGCKRVLHFLRRHWRAAMILTAFAIMFLVLIIWKDPKASCGLVMMIMAVLWITEVLPLAVTAMFPVALFPLLNVAPSDKIAFAYMAPSNFLLLGSMAMAIAIEESALHKRIALKVLLCVGCERRWYILGVMSVTAFLSMWMSNTAAAALMLPVVQSVLEHVITVELKKRELEDTTETHSTSSGSVSQDQVAPAEQENIGKQPPSLPYDMSSGELEPENDPDTTFTDAIARSRAKKAQGSPADLKTLPKRLRRLCHIMVLSVAYGANLGGISTLTGTISNMVLTGILSKTYGNAYQDSVNFLSWLGFGLPITVMGVLFGWMWLVVYFLGLEKLCGCRLKCKRQEDSVSEDSSNEDMEDMKEILKQKYAQLGAIKFCEWAIMFWFVMFVLLLVLKAPLNMSGWADWFGIGQPQYFDDACSAMLIAIILFVFPNKMPDFFFLRDDPKRPPKIRDALLPWKAFHRKFPWGVVLLMGSGLAISEAAQICGLHDYWNCAFKNALSGLPPLAIVFLVVVAVTFMTEIASNTVVVGLITPMLLSIAEGLNINPLLLCLPATVSASFAFMLPVATPPNAIAHETAMINTTDMVSAGIIMNIFCIALVMLATSTWAYPLFKLSTFPNWAVQGNVTTVCQ